MRALTVIAFALGAVVAFATPLSARAAKAPEAAAGQRYVDFVRAAAAPGDVIFIRGRGIWGAMAARFSNRDRTFGHVGLIAVDDLGRLTVVHAGGDPASPEGRVRQDLVSDFLDSVKVVAIYTPRAGDLAAARAIAFAKEAVRTKAPFDRQFSLDTRDALYCTELIWRAYSHALGEDVVPRKSMRENTEYIALDDLHDAPFLKEKGRTF
ncbi:MAG: YiiX/YebB-like N1pC/P60 family cysteine hydrolase [Pseudomonadota bacterium]